MDELAKTNGCRAAGRRKVSVQMCLGNSTRQVEGH